MKNWKAVLKGKGTLHEIFNYFKIVPQLLLEKSNVNKYEDLLDIDLLEKALTVRAAKKVSDCMKKLENSKASNKEKENSLYGMNIV